MQSEDWKKVKELLNEVLQIQPPERQFFLSKSGFNQTIINEVKSMLAVEAEAEKLMNLSAIEFTKDFFVEEDSNSLIGQQIGVYRIIRELGYGGMGAVYLAERIDEKFEQKVALKLLKREMNTSAIRRRFQQERKILASLEHPNIARLLDAGTTDDKIPYLIMEYIEGLSIVDYCNKNHLDLNHRLDLFRKVCGVINFAHRNLIVHRDLKPSNILIDSQGNPKLLDFGISKILSAEFEQANSATITKMGAMTPSYASPEQIQNKSVTTATDIYSLGVILYELLSGHRPFEDKETDFKEIYKAVIEIDPPLPSSLINKISKESEEFAKTETESIIENSRKSESKNEKSGSDTEANKIRQTIHGKSGFTSQSLRGDLDNIVLKALRKEPERRYLSAENFAEDIHRHQLGLPVTASPNTFSYQVGKFVKRNKVAVTLSCLMLAAMVLGITATIWQARIAQAERDRAQLEAEKAKKINAYTQNILNFSNPLWGSPNPQRNREAKISDALEEALKNIDTDLADQPEIQAEILSTIGTTYIGHGQYDKSIQLLERAIEKFDQTLGSNNTKSMKTSVTLAEAVYLKGRINDAEKLLVEAVDYFRPLIAKDKSQTKVFALASNNLATIYMGVTKYKEAEELWKESISVTKEFTGKERQIVPAVLGSLGFLYASNGRFSEAIDLYKQALDELILAGDADKYDAGTLYMKMGVTFFDMEDYEQANNHYQKSYDILLKTVGEENLYSGIVLYRIAHNFYKQERLGEAEKLVNENLERQIHHFPNGHILVGWLERLKGEIYTKTDRIKKGEVFLRKSLAYFLKTHKEPSRNISQVKLALGENLSKQNRFDEAQDLIKSALENSIKSLGENHYFTKQCQKALDNLKTIKTSTSN